MHLLAALEPVIRKAGEIIRADFGRLEVLYTKTSATDLVTKADRAVEAELLDQLARLVPEAGFLAEESASTGNGQGLTWVVDPIDGTTNFVHGFPFVAISVALWDNGAPLLGVVYNPILNEYFCASTGEGSTLNNHPLTCGDKSDLSQALVATGFPYDFKCNPRNNLQPFAALHAQVRGIRRAGSAALDLCYVARGVFDAYWEYHLKPWDAAAGVIIAMEAGATVTAPDGSPWQFFAPGVLASRPGLHGKILPFLHNY